MCVCIILDVMLKSHVVIMRMVDSSDYPGTQRISDEQTSLGFSYEELSGCVRTMNISRLGTQTNLHQTC